jgi:alpha-L-fucosidase
MWINHQWTDLRSITNGEWSGSFWQPADDDKAPWTEIDLEKSQKISKVILYESGKNIKSFELQYKAGDIWKTFYKGTTIGPRAEVSIKPIEARFIRLVISSFDAVPQVYEIILLN